MPAIVGDQFRPTPVIISERCTGTCVLRNRFYQLNILRCGVEFHYEVCHFVNRTSRKDDISDFENSSAPFFSTHPMNLRKAHVHHTVGNVPINGV